MCINVNNCRACLLLLLFGLFPWLALAEPTAAPATAAEPASTPAPAPVLVGLDAAFGHKVSTSERAIQQGLEIAIAEINASGGVLGGRPLELVTTDNRSLPARAVDNVRELAAMPDLVAVFGGKFSPTYVELLPVVHELGLPLLDPWGAADTVINHSFQPSYTFRLSLKDSWAAPVMLRHALEVHGARRLGVLLPNTAWGRSNETAIARAAGALGQAVVAKVWYNWGDTSLRKAYDELLDSGAEVVILVANAAEGSILVREMAERPVAERLPIVSHWGITGGAMVELCGPALDAVDLSVVQTFSFFGREQEPAAQRVLAALRDDYGIAGPVDLKAPVGVAHAYDLMHLLATAIDLAGGTDRATIRDVLENLGPYDGLIKHYPHPFTAERHEALDAGDVFMARYGEAGQILPIGH
ncbi:ABC transporter substrate-binding protein [Thiohalocapsa marina]|uniref:ABC transporter substrate-binding protein n=1 Tax=Thiohalocapsa marina TaxID=424902 RepID=A0A5M8FVM4_9GAMM|nr:ABC transporter substrate-binding protein [Thiohalocapsa marina]KAA6187874.1 ABC transporter substrate-binding protein [Thiohalocapsa marina]